METPGAQTTVAWGTSGQTEELARVMGAPLLFFYFLGTDLEGPIAGDIGTRESVVLVYIVMLLVGIGLYFVNNLVQRRLDRTQETNRRRGES